MEIQARDLTEKAKILLASIDDVKVEMELRNFADNNQSTWLESNKLISQWSTYLSLVQYLDTYERLVQMDKVIDYWTKQRQLLTDHKCWENEEKLRIVQLNRCELLKTYEQWLGYRSWCLIKINKIKKALDHSSKAKYWNSIQDDKVYYLAIQKINNKLLVLNTDMCLAKSELDKYSVKYMYYQQKQDDLSKINQVLAKFKVIHSTIKIIIGLMSEYRIYLYKDIIIPKVTVLTNQLVENITQNGQYHLVGQPDTSTRGSIYFNWSIGNVAIEKSGGFRKFIFGLAMRIAITQLGVSSIACKQLFIDEGFVSADQENLEKIPEFIHSLIGNGIYTSVILVSHLELIKDCGDIKVNIDYKSKKLRQLTFDGNMCSNAPKLKLNLSKGLTSKVEVPDKLKKTPTSTIISKCLAKTSKGTMCTNNQKNGTYCTVHAKIYAHV